MIYIGSEQNNDDPTLVYQLTNQSNCRWWATSHVFFAGSNHCILFQQHHKHRSHVEVIQWEHSLLDFLFLLNWKVGKTWLTFCPCKSWELKYFFLMNFWYTFTINKQQVFLIFFLFDAVFFLHIKFWLQSFCLFLLQYLVWHLYHVEVTRRVCYLFQWWIHNSACKRKSVYYDF